jgi:hypothetical protein
METQDRWAFLFAKIAIAIMVGVVVIVMVLNRGLKASGQDFTNTNLAAPFSVLGFLAGAATLVVLSVVIVGAVVSHRKNVARAVALVVAVEVVLYGALLVGYSKRSREVVLQAGEEKFFCEIDCHLGYTITDVKREGGSVHVALRTRFDEHTTAPWRGNAALHPNPRVVELVDISGRVFAARQSAGPSLSTPLRPGESYVSEFAFTLPPDARDPRVLVATDATFPERLMIGNENSFLHRKVLFRM